MRIVPITESLAKRIEKLPRFPHGYIFGGYKGKIDQHHLNDEIRNRCKLLGIKKNITCHSFRRSFITECANNNENQMKVSRIVGHRNINSTNRYYYGSIQALREVVENLPICAARVGIDVVKRRAKRFVEGFKNTKFKILYKEEPKKVLIEISES
jgi:integrase